MEQRQVLCCDPKETIDGFNLSFCKALLAKLEQLHSEGRIIDKNKQYTRMGALILTHLSDQTKCYAFSGVYAGSAVTDGEIKDIPVFIEDTREFLSIFEEDKPSKIIGGIDLAFCELLLEKLEAMQLFSYEIPEGTYIELSGAAAVYLNHLTERMLKAPTNYTVGSNINKFDYDLIVMGAKAFLATLKEYKR